MQKKANYTIRKWKLYGLWKLKLCNVFHTFCNLRTIAAINITLPERNIDDSAHYEDISEDVNIQMQGQGTLNCIPDANFVYGCFIKNAQITKLFHSI